MQWQLQKVPSYSPWWWSEGTETCRSHIRGYFKYKLYIFCFNKNRIFWQNSLVSKVFLVQIFKIPQNPQQHTVQILHVKFQWNQTISVPSKDLTELSCCHWTRYVCCTLRRFTNSQEHNTVDISSSFLTLCYTNPHPHCMLYNHVSCSLQALRFVCSNALQYYCHLIYGILRVEV